MLEEARKVTQLERRGVGGEHRVGRHVLFEPLEDFALRLQLFDHGLDDDLALGHICQVAREVHARHDRVALFRGQLPAFDATVEALL